MDPINFNVVNNGQASGGSNVQTPLKPWNITGPFPGQRFHEKGDSFVVTRSVDIPPIYTFKDGSLDIVIPQEFIDQFIPPDTEFSTVSFSSYTWAYDSNNVPTLVHAQPPRNLSPRV